MLLVVLLESRRDDGRIRVERRKLFNILEDVKKFTVRSGFDDVFLNFLLLFTHLLKLINLISYWVYSSQYFELFGFSETLNLFISSIIKPKIEIL